MRRRVAGLCVARRSAFCQDDFSGDADLGSSSSNLLFISTFEVKQEGKFSR